ncbi:phosphotransferase family protein [Dactylosporangium sp. CA-233914]|uniref:phosphotransferase family protein n=1 Tax=Dactylosporangium sp. CA-233914 TaxID=3239934 RepID=UPI003D8F7A25
MEHDVRGVVRRNLSGVAGDLVEPLGRGLDNTAYLVDGAWVVRFPGDPEALDVEREARLLREIAGVLDGIVAVPEPAFVADGAMGYALLPGVPLMLLQPPDLTAIADTLASVLTALHAQSPARFAGLVSEDADPPSTWLDELRGMTVDLPEAVAFLEAAPPAPATTLVFSHNDLGAEHVLVDPETWRVTGIIDWSDAALCDPAYDYGLLLRDLGPQAPAPPPPLRERALFYARAGLIEDLAYGEDPANPDPHRSTYVRKSRDRAKTLFHAD